MEAALLRMLTSHHAAHGDAALLGGSSRAIDDAMIDALLSKTNESQQQLLNSILGDNRELTSVDDEAHAALMSTITLGDGLAHPNTLGAAGAEPFDYAAHLPRFIEAMRVQSTQHGARPLPKTVLRGIRDQSDELEVETLEDSDGPQSVLDAMLSCSEATSGKGSDASSAWREAARGVVFDNFFSPEDSEVPSATNSHKDRQQDANVNQRSTTPASEDDEDIDLPETGSRSPPVAHEVEEDANIPPGLPTSPQLLQALKEIAQGEDGVEEFALDATHDYDVNIAGTSRRI
jgi:hypothetical protein